MNEVGKGNFTFEVVKDADKKAIKDAVSKKFKVNVLAVSTSVIKGKRKKSGIRRIEKREFPSKKAVVTLKTGQKIDLFEAGT